MAGTRFCFCLVHKNKPINEIMMKNENSVVSVPSAYNTGVVTLVVMPNISKGKVLYVPAVSSVLENSS